MKSLFAYLTYIMLFLNQFGHGQVPIVINSKNATFTLQKITGFGPRGINSLTIGAKDFYKDKEEFKAYPVMKNKPQYLTDVVEYFFILDQFQFYYQNYRSGVFKKDFFVKKVKELNKNLIDTVNLSALPIKCSVSVLAGYDTSKEAVYIIDANNNDDFGDDVIKPLSPNAFRQDVIISASIPVKVSYLSGKKIVVEEIPVFVSNNSTQRNLRLSFSFPEFKYTRFRFRTQPYIMCTSYYLGQPNIAVLPDVPYFTSINRGKIINPNQFVQLGNSTFKFSGYAENGSKITLTGDDAANFTNTDLQADDNATGKMADAAMVSSQTGFLAPLIKGYTINKNLKSDSLISTEELKGKYVFVDFWSTTCAPCIAELPYLREAYLKFDRKHFEIVGVLDERTKGSGPKLLKQHKVLWPNIKTDTKGTTIIGYNITGYPTTYLIDPTGKIIAANLRGNELVSKLNTLLPRK